MLLIFCAAVFAAEEYNFIVLGDIHFDGEAYHSSAAKKSGKKKEFNRNVSMWTSGKSEQVLAAAGKAVDGKNIFTVQVGDFTQGDCKTEELQEKMFKDGFAAVKKHFPNSKLIAVKGNHDVRVAGKKGNSNEPAAKAFLPLIAKELGRESIGGNYTVRQGKDLFIFFDGFVGAKAAAEFVKKALAENKDARYVFFITHLPVLPCTSRNPGWLIPGRNKILPMLAARNAIIFTAHTHRKSYMSVTTPQGTLSQMVVCSMGAQWNPDKAPGVANDKFEVMAKKALAEKKISKSSVAVLKQMESFTVNEFKMFSGHSGFAVVKVDDKAVVADIHTNNSGKPWTTITLRTNAKMEK